MKNLTFRFITTVKCLSHNKMLNYVVIISMMTGLFYSCALLGSVNYNFHNMKIAASLKDQDFILAEALMTVEDEGKIVSNLKNEAANIQKIGVSAALIRIPAAIGSATDLINLQGIDNSIINMTDWKIHGSLPTEIELKEGSPVALVTVSFMQKYSLKLGDTITAYGKDLQIIGTVINGNLIGNVFIPYKLLKEVSINNSVQYQLFIFGSQLEKDNIKNAIIKYYPDADIVSMRNSKEITSSAKSGFMMVMGISAVHNIITLVLSIVATVIIVSGRLINDRKNMAIKLAHGSSVKNIVADSIFETFIFSVAALILDLILMYLIRDVLSNIIIVMFSWHLILYCLILAGIFSLVVGLISGIAAAHFSVSDMLRV